MLKRSLFVARVELRCPNPRIERAALSIATRRENHHGSDGRNREQKHHEEMNDAQKKASSNVLPAIQFPPSTSLQILAGPGTGKTRVLTSRIAELIRKHSLPPSSICAVTFTRKAAMEMRNRLHHDLGPDIVNQIAIGTFHGICRRFLQDYGSAIGVSPDFLIWDEEECEIIIWCIIQKYKPGIKRESAAQFRQIIAIAKSVPSQSLEETLYELSPNNTHGWILKLFHDYSNVLKASSALDFEDLLNRGLEVIRTVPWAQGIARLQHLLVDEFQDTSSIQSQMIQQLYKATKGRVSVVGDPDQSIYGWRNADVTNFDQMRKELPDTHIINLEENYRSTASILAVALAIISQDSNRPPKSLFTSRSPAGPKPMLKQFVDTAEEGEFIAKEIQRIVRSSNGVLGYGQCAILLRDNYLSKELREALKEAQVPFRILPELSRYDRSEIKTLLAYIRLGLNSAYTPLLVRILEGPHKLESKTIAKLVERAIQDGVTLYDLIEGICDTKVSDLTPPVRTEIEDCVRLIKHMQTLVAQGASPEDFIQYIINTIDYETYLDDTSGKLAAWRKDNVQSFLKLAQDFYQRKSDVYIPPIQGFLNQLSELSKANNADVGKVTILTCHSAKGLEWPVVFIPEGSREELSLTVSDFVNDVEPTLFQSEPPRLGEQELKLFRDILGPRHSPRHQGLV
ncbi:P-loop containing nucleoside triphosphate hydrolase protein [Ceratobasidium sp. AG-I]|nr:P-loop containing nucleoside triphosphate hydrolase protein [Ceratobasidium sp. AG-I]